MGLLRSRTRSKVTTTARFSSPSKPITRTRSAGACRCLAWTCRCDVAGIDDGTAEYFVSVHPDRDPIPVHSFQIVTAGVDRLADSLIVHETVESGVDWP